MADDAHRRAAVARCEDVAKTLPAIARYYSAFRHIDWLIEAVGALITQFATGEGVQSVAPVQVTQQGGDDPEITFVIVNMGGPLFRLNQIVHVQASADELQCLARIEGMTTSWDRQLGESSSVIGRVVASGPEATPEVQPHRPDGGIIEKIRRQR